MDMQVKNYPTSTDTGNLIPSQPTPPSASSVQAFNQQMNGTAEAGASTQGQNNMVEQTGGAAQDQIKEILSQILNILQALLKQMGAGEDSSEGDGKALGGSAVTPGGGPGVSPVEGSGSGGSAGSSENIPPPTENIRQLNLGGKTVTVGGDSTGTASAEEVAQTAQSIEHMYQNSPTFKNMIDNSSDPSFEVSVGRRDDNTSWGNSGGKVFMNINNVAPGNSDSWQSLLSHEFAHASIDIGHGAEMENLEKQAASEA